MPHEVTDSFEDMAGKACYSCVSLIHALLLLTCAGTLRLQAQSDTTCSCTDQLNALIDKVEANYAGYAIETSGDKRGAYDRSCADLRVEAVHADADGCWTVLRRYVDQFQDGHLFISDIWGEYDTTFRRPAERVILDPHAMGGGVRDDIEGDWLTHERQPVTVVRTGRDPNGEHFAAVLTADDVPNWSKGEVKARFTRYEDGSYHVVMLNEKHVEVHPAIYQPSVKGARIVRGSLLMMPPFTWVRATPRKENACVIEADRPLAPQVFAHDAKGSTWVVSLPSCNPMYTERLDSLLKINDDALSHAHLLIIDLRGNEGGSSGMTRALDRYLGARTSEESDTSTAVVLSSVDNIKYFTYMQRDGWVPAGLLPRMQEHPGQLVAFADAPAAASSNEDLAHEAAAGPEHVALLTDRSVVSAGEAFCIRARHYPRVKHFGEPTAGCIDYQNVTMVYFGCKAAGYLLGYPTLASSRYLPNGGYNRTGIVPEVRMPTNVADPYAAVIKYYFPTTR